ncbi:hypothetical protein PR003_g32459 [Phytophthora rubi]|uniref:PiggyBac transposable element-derived protein domain-containing protein n=1 Tax=Phytophthora rubi TaxID=129364 RepID=A0A6A3GF99_9STRA|nr:hypothetical protein PR001_g31390 [Phytophthora rubi]KAE9265428.1 hypothetical protein PR003_g32459 [Phytophthora rubi]
MALRLKGLYARGTVRKTSAHFPRHVLLEKKDCSRGASRQGVSTDHSMVAASWYDSAIVTVISNADPSTLTTVTRQVRAERRSYSAPTCIKEYNASMQGVDRLDQIRARFSLADGHSFKKWHKKLALALVDVSRSNAYLTRRLTVDLSKARDSHRDFIVELCSELISGKWKEAPSERLMFYSDTASSEELPSHASPSSTVWIARQNNGTPCTGSPEKRCSAVSSKQFYTDMNRKRRKCVVCRWEDRYATEVTDVCVLHNVCLCQNVHVCNKPYACPETTWTCWEKYHRFYLPQKLFSQRGKARTSCDLYKLKRSQRSTDGQENLGADEELGVAGAGRTVARSIVL